MYQDILNSTSHREFPMPKGHWMMMQKWEHLLFLHWPVSPRIMKSIIPPGLELDCYGGEAWISILPFKVSKFHLRNFPSIPFYHSNLEINVRTYVKKDGISGVYFFSLDVNKLLIVLGARLATLPYFYSKMALKEKKDSFYFYCSRTGKEPAFFKGSYHPIDGSFTPKKGSLDHWLLERYFFWTNKGDSIYRGGIHHTKWEIQNAKVNIEKQSFTSFLQNDFPIEQALVHYSSSKIALNWMIQKIN